MTTVLVVDKDWQILDLLSNAFTARGYQVMVAANGSTALRTAAETRPGVVVLELGLSDIDGSSLIVAMRGWTDAPIIVLSERDSPEDKVRTLDAGADDYLTKPFVIEELLARVRAVLRRVGHVSERRRIVDAGSFTVDLHAEKVWRDGVEVRLTPTEWRILEILVDNEGRLVTQRHLLKTIWGPERYTDTQYLRVYIAQLRRKLEPVPAHPRHLLTEPNRGYRFHTNRRSL
jgi:two-component system KDP operon response regulator KdpE